MHLILNPYLVLWRKRIFCAPFLSIAVSVPPDMAVCFPLDLIQSSVMVSEPVCYRNKRVYNLWHNLFQVNAEFSAFFSLLSPRIWFNQIASETSKDVGRRWPLQMHVVMVFDIGGKSKPGQVAQKARTIRFRCTQRRSLWASPELVKADSGQSHSHSSSPSLVFTVWSLPVTFSLPKRPVGYGLWLVSRMYLLSLSKPGWWNETQNQQRRNPGWPVPRWPQ